MRDRIPEGNSLTQAIYVCAAQKGAVFAPFCLKMGIKFAHFGLELGMIFERTTEVYERTLQLHPRLTSVFWSMTFKTAAPQIVTDNT